MSLSDATAELASLVARAAHDRGGINPVLVDVTSKLALADAFVVVSAPTDRQVRAIAEDIMDRIWAEQHRRPAHIEGRAEGTWVLLDYSDMLVHVLSEEEREYRLDHSDAEDFTDDELMTITATDVNNSVAPQLRGLGLSVPPSQLERR